MATTDLQAVVDVLQRVYGDATQTALDQSAATMVMRELRSRGWASLQDVAGIIASAPGRSITLDDRAMMQDWTVERTDELGASRVFVTPQVRGD